MNIYVGEIKVWKAQNRAGDILAGKYIVGVRAGASKNSAKWMPVAQAGLLFDAPRLAESKIYNSIQMAEDEANLLAEKTGAKIIPHGLEREKINEIHKKLEKQKQKFEQKILDAENEKNLEAKKIQNNKIVASLIEDKDFKKLVLGIKNYEYSRTILLMAINKILSEK